MRVQVASATASTYTSLRSLNRVRKGDSTVMSRVKSRSLRVPTAAGSIAVALCAAWLPACGGTGERRIAENLSSNDAGVLVDPCNPAATIATESIGCAPYTTKCSDFENGALEQGILQYDPLTPSTNPVGYWTIPQCQAAPDGTDCLAPNPSLGMSATAIPQNEGHCGPPSAYAFHMVARGQLRWGPQALIQYNQGVYVTSTGASLDVSDWDGLAFWIKKGPKPSGSSISEDLWKTMSQSVFVAVIDPKTNGLVKDANGIPTCNAAAIGPDQGKCDQFGFAVSFTEEWEYKVLPFAELKQRGYGVHESSVDFQNIVQLKFGFDIGDWDVWLDDISLWRKK